MGNRLHYHSKHVIKYGNEQDFNYMQEEIYNLLSKYDCEVHADNCSDSCYADSFSVPREQIADMLEKLKKRSPRGIALSRRDFDGVAKWTVQEVIDYFQAAYDNSPKKSEDIYFEWF